MFSTNHPNPSIASINQLNQNLFWEHIANPKNSNQSLWQMLESQLKNDKDSLHVAIEACMISFIFNLGYSEKADSKTSLLRRYSDNPLLNFPLSIITTNDDVLKISLKDLPLFGKMNAMPADDDDAEFIINCINFVAKNVKYCDTKVASEMLSLVSPEYMVKFFCYNNNVAERFLTSIREINPTQIPEKPLNEAFTKLSNEYVLGVDLKAYFYIVHKNDDILPQIQYTLQHIDFHDHYNLFNYFIFHKYDEERLKNLHRYEEFKNSTQAVYEPNSFLLIVNITATIRKFEATIPKAGNMRLDEFSSQFELAHYQQSRVFPTAQFIEHALFDKSNSILVNVRPNPNMDLARQKEITMRYLENVIVHGVFENPSPEELTEKLTSLEQDYLWSLDMPKNDTAVKFKKF